MRQWFEEYGYRIGRRVRADALAREREAYLSSRYVVGMSDWCSEDVVSSYGVAAGAGSHDPSRRKPRRGLALARGGVGRRAVAAAAGPRRDRLGAKGRAGFFSMLPRSCNAWDTMSKSSFSGPIPSRVPAHPSLRALGYVHKGREFQRFVEILRSFHFGCLLSRVEASGFSTLEYLRLGIPIITTAVGGIVDPKGAGLRFPLEADGEQIAEALAGVLREPDRYATMRKRRLGTAWPTVGSERQTRC